MARRLPLARRDGESAVRIFSGMDYWPLFYYYRLLGQILFIFSPSVSRLSVGL